MRVDAHHHLWRYNAEEFSWIDDTSAALRRDFLMSELRLSMQQAGIQATILVQARSSLEETHWLLEQAAEAPEICGVVGWVPLRSEKLSSLLDELSPHASLVAFREITEAEPQGYLERPDVHRGIALITERGYGYDLLIRGARQRQKTLAFVDQHPNTRFVLDHAGKPPSDQEGTATWRTWMHSLAQREHVACKISGLATQLSWQNWDLQVLRPYLDACVEAFGTKRLLAGSDWPVCLLATGYERWWQTLELYFSAFGQGEKEAIFGDNALAFYCRQSPHFASQKQIAGRLV